MAGEKKCFFISYTSADAAWATRIARMLEDEGHRTIIQAWDFEVGSNFVACITDAIETCDYVIFVMSKKYFESPWCKEEWTSVLAIQDLPMIPIRIEKIKPPGLMNPRSYVDLFGMTEDVARKKLLDFVEKKINGIPRVPVGESPFLEERVQGLPYPRNPHFTGRDDTLRTIHQNFEAGDTVAITQSIAGLGGIGKTQTAMEYAYRYAAHYKTIWWVAAETPQTTQESFLKFVRKMQLLPPDIMEESVITGAVQNWLSQNEGWLFIYDNATGGKQLESYLPRTATGHVLITTRDTTMNVSQSVPLDVFSPEDALDFLAKRTGIQGDETNARLLAERLGHLPLALEQAAAYIYGKSIGYEKHLSYLEKYKGKILSTKGALTHYDKSVMETFSVSAQDFEESTCQLLYLFAYFAPDDIDITWITAQSALLPPALQALCENELALEDALETLRKYALIKKEENNISMHRLLQEVIQEQLAGDATWIAYCLAIIHKLYDYEHGNIDSQKLFARVSPHATAIAEKAEMLLAEDAAQEVVAWVYHKAGWGLCHMAVYKESVEWYQKALNIREKVLGLENTDTAFSYNDMAMAYAYQGENQEAQKLFQTALDIREKVLGIEHADTAMSYNNIGYMYSQCGDFDKAMEWDEKARHIREKVLGREHADTAMSYNNIAAAYEKQGEYAEALKWYQKALGAKEKMLGKEHPSTAATYNNIAYVYDSQGKYDDALDWYQKALGAKEKVLGKEHPSTAATYNNIAYLYEAQGDPGSALSWMQKAYPIFKKILGENHPYTRKSLATLKLIHTKLNHPTPFATWLTETFPDEESQNLE